MADVIMRFRILPRDLDVDLGELREEIERGMPEGASVVSSGEEAIAFGIKALIIDVRARDEGGIVDRVEEAIKRSERVSQADITMVSRYG